MCQLNFNILRNLIASVFIQQNTSKILFSNFSFNKEKTIKSLNKSYQLIRNNPNILVSNEQYDPDVLKIIAETIIILTKYFISITPSYTIDDLKKDNVKQAIFNALELLEYMQIQYNYLGFYDQNSNDQWILRPLESLGIHANPLLLVPSIILCKCYDHASAQKLLPEIIYSLQGDHAVYLNFDFTTLDRNNMIPTADNMREYLGLIQQMVFFAIAKKEEKPASKTNLIMH